MLVGTIVTKFVVFLRIAHKFSANSDGALLINIIFKKLVLNT